MATIQYKCDTCKREISLTENVLGMTVFGRCIITEGCKGVLYKQARNENVIRQEGDFPAPVAGLNDYVQRKAFYEQSINISTTPWRIEHNLGVAPAVTVYFTNNETNEPYEISPDEYTVTIIDQNNIEISFASPSSGIVHLVARSSLPSEITTETSTVELFQVSYQGHMIFAIPSLIIENSGPFDGINLYMTEDDMDIETNIQIPSSSEVTIDGTFLLNAITASSPWQGIDQILLRKRRNFTLKDLNVATMINAAFSNITDINDVPNGTTFTIPKIKFRYQTVGYEGELNTVEPRQLITLLSNSPYGTTDKIRDQIVDVGELLTSSNSQFVVYDGEVYVATSNIESVYPRIEESAPTALLISPTPQATAPETPPVTPPNTPASTPPSTPGATPAPTVSETPPGTPPNTPAPTVSETPPGTPPNTPAPTASETPPTTPGVTPPNTPAPTVSETPPSTPPNTPPNTPAPTVSETPPNTPPPASVTPTPSPAGFIDISNDSQSVFAEPGNSVLVKVGFTADGGYLSDSTINFFPAPAVPSSTQWFNGTRTASTGQSYEIRATYISGNDTYETSGHAAGVWHSLGSARGWEWELSVFGIYTPQIQFEIRDAATQTILDSMVFSVNMTIGF